jgi:sugar transferase (PEP-CTERM/EpsH1 system associated)
VTTRQPSVEPDRAPVLYLTHRVPFPPDKGDRIRNFHLLRQLAARGRVWLGCLADEPVPAETTAELNRLCERVAVVPVGQRGRWVKAGWSLLTGRSLSEGLFAEAALRRVIREWTAETPFRAAVVSASSLVPYLRRDGLEKTPAVVDLVDVDSQKWLDFAAASRVPKRWLYRLEARRVRKLEAGLPKWVRAVSVVSRAEADVYDSFAGAGAATVATNGVDLDYFRPDSSPHAEREDSARGASGPLSCVFVGAMDYLPNVDGAVWFAREVWPLIRARFPDAEFRIVGRKPTPAVETLAALPGVTVTGSVPDVRPFVASAAVVVAPLRLARGVQNKVLEALAMAKPVVAAPPALAALGTVPGTDVLAATTPAEFADAVGALFADPDRRRALGAAGRRYVERHHHWEHCLEPLMAKIFAPDASPERR